MTEIAIGYQDSPLNGPGLGTGPKPGQRVAPVADQTAVGSGDVPRFALLAERTAATAALVRTFAGLLEPDIRPPRQPGAIWLVRPDGYVSCSTRDPHAVAGYLESLGRRAATAGR